MNQASLVIHNNALSYMDEQVGFYENDGAGVNWPKLGITQCIVKTL
jgi:hypothetical protein